MGINLSPKYNDLFKILNCWDVVNSPNFNELPKQKQDSWNILKGVDTVVIYGGRDSSKTFPISLFIPIAVKDYGHRVLYTRYTMGSTDQSITNALNSRMEEVGITNCFDYASNVYECKNNNGRIFITGQKTSSGNQTAKLKSLEDFSIFVTDEAEEVKSYDEWDKIRKSVRAKDVQCLSILIFNPPTKEHWLYTDLFEDLGVSEGFTGIKDNIMYIHTSYLDNINNIAEHNLREYLKLKDDYEEYLSTDKELRDSLPQKIKKNYKKYKHVVLGGFLDVAEGVIYEDWEEGEFNDSLPYVYGLDFGSNDPDALTKVAVDKKNMKIYVKECYFRNNTSTAQLMEVLHDVVGTNDLIIADSAERRLIQDFYNGMHSTSGEWLSSVNIRKVRKSKGVKDNFVARRIKTIQGYTIVVAPDSPNVKKALNNYVWHDKRANIPKHDWSDLMDSMGYAAMELIEY
jgi:phage terminase large subunit